MNTHSTKSIFMLFVISMASALAACSSSPQNSAAQPTASGIPAVTVVDQQFDGSHIAVADARIHNEVAFHLLAYVNDAATKVARTLRYKRDGIISLYDHGA